MRGTWGSFWLIVLFLQLIFRPISRACVFYNAHFINRSKAAHPGLFCSFLILSLSVTLYFHYAWSFISLSFFLSSFFLSFFLSSFFLLSFFFLSSFFLSSFFLLSFFLLSFFLSSFLLSSFFLS